MSRPGLRLAARLAASFDLVNTLTATWALPAPTPG
ncbi:hypothetical protein ACIDI_59c00280 [Acidiphilium sp. JA12-A1]|nr:hypothetical protein ACIDI_59c00280 [Acidiphilium sp. JA12-A1]